MNILPIEFYNRPTLVVARNLLGMRLVRMLDGVRLSGIIIETEAYIGESDMACHARAGRTGRTRVMYGTAGKAYVYFNYGKHWMLNAVTEAEGFPAAVLIRAVRVTEGWGVVELRRAKVRMDNWTNGPAKLTQAFGIDASHNNIDLTSEQAGLWIEEQVVISDANVTIGARVGLYNVPEPWKSMPWRFLVNE
jgi:DNA-3-methyladenine glycosylase